MLKLITSDTEFFDDVDQTFKTIPGRELMFEHSLVSLSKWESLWEKPFLGKEEKSTEETTSYLLCMAVTPDVTLQDIQALDGAQIRLMRSYIDRTMTATTFRESKGTPNSEIMTAELFYYSMITFNIPFECQYWHLKRLTTLIQVCAAKQEKPKKMSKSELAARNRSLNAQRRKDLNSSG
mgnify:CR=1